MKSGAGTGGGGMGMYIYGRCWRDISTCRGPGDKTTLVSGTERKLIWPEAESRGYDVQEGLEGQAENTRD